MRTEACHLHAASLWTTFLYRDKPLLLHLRDTNIIISGYSTSWKKNPPSTCCNLKILATTPSFKMIFEVCLLKWHLLNNLPVNGEGAQRQLPLTFTIKSLYLPIHFNISLRAWATPYIQVNTHPREGLVRAEMSPVTVPKVKDESTKPLLWGMLGKGTPGHAGLG